MLACIICENVLLLTLKQLAFVPESETINLFLPTVCVSCEEEENRKVLIDKGSTTAIWTSLSINHGMIRTWQPFEAMKTYLKGTLIVPAKVSLVRRDKIRGESRD